MKIAVTSSGKDLSSQIDPRFGRAAYFLIVDTETMEFQVVDNTQGMGFSHGAGPQAAQKIVDHNAKVLLTGNCGPNAFRALQAAGIEVVINVAGAVKEAVERYKAGELQAADTPNVPGHWR
ncbi:MAG: NifB/NifX family molybdenum-iron cluster-binding protein [Deltaproteobacteria bacterium]|nr:NifB/NifX family molybdenum-iron cluster-binding protein [Deltaproteobacteria bacterium]MBW2307995.1 NifB/NifX family molybdenum-iron cluster-binding protein [Deltaproteobacteria bacterium]